MMMRKMGQALVPGDKYAEEALKTIKGSDSILIEWRKPRNPAHHRKVLGMITYLVENTDIFKNKDQALDALKWNAGIYRTSFQWNHRRQEMEPKETLDSISFSAMSQDKFELFAAASIDFIALLTRDEPDNVRRNLETYF